MFDKRKRSTDRFSARKERKACNKKYEIRFRKGKKQLPLSD